MSAPTIAVGVLTKAETEIVTRPIVGDGGMQALLRRVLQKLNRETGRFEMLPGDVEKARRYASKYGNGGYQERLRALLAAIDRQAK